MKHSFLLLFFFGSLSFGQETDALVFQRDMNEKFSNPEKTPLTEEDLKEFTALDFFKIDSTFKVKVHFLRTPAEAPFRM